MATMQILIVVAMMISMQGCVVLVAGAAIVSAPETSSLDASWWKTATLYQIYPRSFKDSDGDGIGDLKGITQSADYLKEIGVDAVWLTPIFKTPNLDFGFDISDFREIDPTFGTLDDFKELVAKMKLLDIKLLLDMVPNHSSDQHEWFNKSLHREDPYTDYYVWNDGKIDPETNLTVPPNNWMSKFNGSVWEWREERQQYYLHLFSPEQVDFDFRNPAVVKEFDDIMAYWLDLGVDGFRLDSVMFLVEGDHGQDEPQLPGTEGLRWEDYNHTLTLGLPGSLGLVAHWEHLLYNYSLRDGRQRALFMDSYYDGEDTLKLYGHGNTSFAMPLNFNIQQQTSSSTRAEEFRDIIHNYLASLTTDETPNWVIGNHDNIRVADRYGPEAVDAMGMLLGVLSGVKVVYYGEEIGMQDTFVRWNQTVDHSAVVLGPNHYQERDRDPVRTPMQWDNSTSAGFSPSNKTWLPVNVNYRWLNVAAQWGAEQSHLKVFRDVSTARRDPVLQRGSTLVVASDNNTLVVMRYYSGSFYIYVYNMGSENVEYTTQNFFSPLGVDLSMSVEVVSTNGNVAKGTVLRKGSASVNLRPKSAVILRSPPSASSSSSSLRALLILPTIVLVLKMLI